MLVVRYFLYVGGALIALLLVGAAVLPKPSPTEGTVASADDVPAIRIQSDRKWPARVSFDTNAQMPAAPAVAQVQAPAPPPPAVAESSTNNRMREAFAQASSGQSKPALAEVKKRQPKPRRRIARARVAPQYYGSYGHYGSYGYGRQPMQVAQQPRFGFFW